MRSSFIIFVILIPGIIMALTDRFKALLLYLWFAFFRPGEWIWFDISSFRLSLVLGLILLIPSLLTGVFPNLTHPLSVGSLLFLGTCLVGQFTAIKQALGWQWIDFLARLILVSLLAVTLIRTPRDLMRVIAVIAGSLGFFGTKAGFVSLIAGGIQFSAGLAGAFIDNNGYALAIVMTMPLLIALAQNAELTFSGLMPAWTIKFVRVGLYIAVPFCGYAVVSTFSRGGLVAMVATTFTFLLFQKRRIRLIVGFALLLFVVLETIPLPEGYADRVQTLGATSDEDLENTSEGRLHFWAVAMNMAEAHPFGVGIRNFEEFYNAYDTSGGHYGKKRSVHSSHFQVLAELGYVGALIWLFQFAYGFHVAFRVRKRSRVAGLTPIVSRFLATVSVALMVSMVGFLVGGAFIALALNDLTWLTFGLLAALDIMSARLCREAAASASGDRPVLA